MKDTFPTDATQVARDVITAEADALVVLSRHLPEDFAKVVDLITNATGRVIVAGIGKSGHIGRKIAATLASTGTPAQFVHAAEASHGDLGMITKADVALLISNSGETHELKDMLAHTRRFNVPLVGLSAKPDSTLMRAADYRLTIPKLPEACGIGMVPTTSTTLTLALGDALSVALLRQRNFRAEDFAVFHPGGKLGAQMARVAELMHEGDDLPRVLATAPMSDVLIEMTSKSFGVAAVVEGDRLIGVVTDGDLRRHITTLMDQTASDIATQDPITVTPDMLAASALAVMQDHKITALMVCDDQNTLLGLLHLHDLLRAGVT